MIQAKFEILTCYYHSLSTEVERSDCFGRANKCTYFDVHLLIFPGIFRVRRTEHRRSCQPSLIIGRRLPSLLLTEYSMLLSYKYIIYFFALLKLFREMSAYYGILEGLGKLMIIDMGRGGQKVKNNLPIWIEYINGNFH